MPRLCCPGLCAQVVTFSAMGLPADYQLVDGWLVARGEQVLEQSRTHLIGEHNAENMLAALAVADLYAIPRQTAIGALCCLSCPLPHRLEKVAEIDGTLFLNDSKATNIDALEKALIAMRTPVVLIAGGKDKGLDFAGLRFCFCARRSAPSCSSARWRNKTAGRSGSSAVPCRRVRNAGGSGATRHAVSRASRRHGPLFPRLFQLRHVQEF